MEVVKDHSASHAPQPMTIIGGMKSASRFAVLAGLAFVGGDAPVPQPKPAEPQQTVAVSTSFPGSYSVNIDSLDGQSLIGPRMNIENAGGSEVDVRIERIRGTLRIVADGKHYGIQDHPLAPNVTLGATIDEISLRSTLVELFSSDYGTAEVERSEVKRVVAALASSEESIVHLTVAARFTPKEGTAVAAAVALKRMWDGTDGSQPEFFQVAFERTHDPTVLAMTLPSR